MSASKLCQVLESRAHKQRWLLDQLRERGEKFSETYLSQVKSGTKTPSRRFIDAVSATLGMPEDELFDTEAAPRGRPLEGTMATETNGANKREIKVAVIRLGNCASAPIQGVQCYRDAGDNDRVRGLVPGSRGGAQLRDTD